MAALSLEHLFFGREDMSSLLVHTNYEMSIISWLPFLTSKDMAMQVCHRLFPFARGLFEVQYLSLHTHVCPSVSIWSTAGQGSQFLVFSITNCQDEGLSVSDKTCSADVCLTFPCSTYIWGHLGTQLINLGKEAIADH